MSRLIRITRALSAATILLTSASLANAQEHPQLRQGFWFNIGLGGGSLGCEDCSTRSTGLSGQLSLGGTINQRFLLGASSNAWTKSEGSATLTMSSLAVVARFYPSATGGFYFNGGLGVASLDIGLSGYGSDGTTGTSAILGVGYDARIGKRVSLTPFFNSIGGAFDGATTNVVQVGVGVTWH